MTVAKLIAELQKCPNRRATVFVTVEDIGMQEVTGGLAASVGREGEGEELGHCVIYAKG